MSTKSRIPALKYHAPTRQHYVWHAKKRVHMGRDPETAQARYRRWASEFLAAADPAAPIPVPKPTAANPHAGRTVAEVLVAYWKFVLVEYAGNAGTRHRIRTAIDAVRGLYPDLPAAQFRGPQLKALRADLVARRTVRNTGPDAGKPITRTYVNYLVACVQRMWAWALSEDLVPADGAATVAALEPLRKGRGGREPRRVLPAAPGWAEALVEAPDVLAALARVQALCGMRPQDACRMRRGELSTAPGERVPVPDTGRHLAAFVEDGQPVWVYVPAKHKTTWQGKPRAVAVGPQAQALLRPLLEGLAPDDFVFSPAKALAQIGRGNRYKHAGYKSHYATRQYAQFVTRAIERANARRRKMRWLPEELVPHWSPNQLRHLAATVVGDELDREHARALLGQSSSGVIDTYMEQQLRKAVRAAARCG
jgi:integrase